LQETSKNDEARETSRKSAQDKYTSQPKTNTKYRKSAHRQMTTNSEIDEQHPGKRIIMSSAEHHTVT
jgi:hypothetical protein